MKKGFGRRGQVWVETVLYTLIGLAVMGIILAGAKGPIEKKQDEIAIEQAVESMGVFNEKIYEVSRATGNRRALDLKIGKGIFTVDTDNNTILWKMDSRYKYSELNVSIPHGIVTVLTEAGNPYVVTLSIEYPFELRFGDQTEGVKDFMKAAIPYSFTVENVGLGNDNRLAIVVKEV